MLYLPLNEEIIPIYKTCLNNRGKISLKTKAENNNMSKKHFQSVSYVNTQIPQQKNKLNLAYIVLEHNQLAFILGKQNLFHSRKSILLIHCIHKLKERTIDY